MLQLLISETDRGQTEPLAALIAVTFLAIGVALYGNVIIDAIPGDEQTNLEDVTMDRVWNEVAVDGRYNESKKSIDDLNETTFPEGKVVHVNITYQRSDGTRAVVTDSQFDRSGQPMAVDPPEETRDTSRPIPVSLDSDPSGTVRTGRLTVEVWE